MNLNHYKFRKFHQKFYATLPGGEVSKPCAKGKILRAFKELRRWLPQGFLHIPFFVTKIADKGRIIMVMLMEDLSEGSNLSKLSTNYSSGLEEVERDGPLAGIHLTEVNR